MGLYLEYRDANVTPEIWDMYLNDDYTDDDIRRALKAHKKAEERAEVARRAREPDPVYNRQLEQIARDFKRIRWNEYLIEKSFNIMYGNGTIDGVFADETAAAKAAAHDAAQAVRDYRRHVGAANADERLTAAGKDERISAARNIAATKLDATFETARAGIAKAHDALTDILKPKENDYTAEIKEQRAWNRYRQFLDSGTQPLEVIERAADDPVALRALRADLPAYLAASGREDQVTPLMGAVDRAERPHLDTVKQHALDLREELSNGDYRLTVAEQAARGEIEDGSTAYAITTWPGDEHGAVIRLDQ